MSARLVGVLSVAALLAVGCASGTSVGLVTDGESALEWSPGGSPSRDDLLVSELPAGELVADSFLSGAGVFAGSAGESASEFPFASTGGGSEDSLVLVSVGVSSLTLGWGEDLAEGASGFRLRWRVRPFEEPEEGEGNEGEETWSVVDLPASARSYTITGLAAGGRYVVRVSVLDSSGVRFLRHAEALRRWRLRLRLCRFLRRVMTLQCCAGRRPGGRRRDMCCNGE